MFWEIVPKTYATHNATEIALFVAKPYKLLMKAFYPVILFIEYITKKFWSKGSKQIITDEEMEAFIDMWRKSWTLEDKEHKQIRNLLEFNETTVWEIMTPRVKIDSLDSETNVNSAIDYMLNCTHTRIPVFIDTIDKIAHTVTLRKLLKEKEIWNDKKKLSEIELDVDLKVPISQPIDKMLEVFKKSRKHIAIVMDEYGWVAWIVSLEDVIEEVFWDIKDETDKETDEIIKLEADSYKIQSYITIEDVLKLFSLKLSDTWVNHEEYLWKTLSYFITHKLERFPAQNEILKIILNNEKKKYLIIKTWRIIWGKIWEVYVSLKKEK